MKYIIAILTGIIMIGLFLKWTNDRDVKVIESSQKYEECVRVEYNTTPWEYYNENGKYPVCIGK